MDRRLIIMRHAQSAAGTIATADHDRQLTDAGESEAQSVAQQLVELGWVPQLVLSSDARRTRETWEQMSAVFKADLPITFEEDLYLGGVTAIENALFAVDDEITDVLILGHNPGCQNAITYFSGRAERMSTANAVLLHCTSDGWSQAAQSGKFSFVQHLRP